MATVALSFVSFLINVISVIVFFLFHRARAELRDRWVVAEQAGGKIWLRRYHAEGTVLRWCWLARAREDTFRVLDAS